MVGVSVHIAMLLFNSSTRQGSFSTWLAPRWAAPGKGVALPVIFSLFLTMALLGVGQCAGVFPGTFNIGHRSCFPKTLFHSPVQRFLFSYMIPLNVYFNCYLNISHLLLTKLLNGQYFFKSPYPIPIFSSLFITISTCLMCKFLFVYLLQNAYCFVCMHLIYKD